MVRPFVLLAAGAACLTAAAASSEPCPPPVEIPLELQGVISRSSPAFTQGLVFANGSLYESSGLYGSSSLNRIDLETGEVSLLARLPSRVFAEGLDFWNGRFLQLTWKEGLALFWNEQAEAPPNAVPYRFEGWGLTHDSRSWIASDGTSALRFLEPGSLSETRKVRVRIGAEVVEGLNELEYVKGKVFANVFPTERILRIDPETGCADGVLDLKDIPDVPAPDGESVANGIAYDSESESLYITGKNWPVILICSV